MNYMLEDTICAPATSVGGAVAMIRVSGPQALEIVDKVVKFRRGNACESKGYSLKFGSISGLDDVVVSLYRNPNSYTGEDSAEISCHASSFIVSSLLDRLVEAGCRLAEAGEFTRRAFVNGKMDLAQAESVADLIASTSLAQHRVAFNQLRGGYSAELAGIRGQLLELASLLELELDFSEEELEFADRGRLAKLLDAAIARCRSLSDSFRLGNAIRNGVPVAIVGSPNSGKSTLLNLLLNDDRAIVSDIPGTTRDTVEETCDIGGVVFRFIDTAGIRESSDVVERMGIERSFAKASSAEIVLGLVDINSDISAEIKALKDLDISGKLLILINKVDSGLVGGVGLVGGGVGFGGEGVGIGDGIGLGFGEEGVGVGVGFGDDGVGVGGDTCHCERSVATEHCLQCESERKRTAIGSTEITEQNDILYISAKTGQGLPELRSKLVSMVGKIDEDAILVTNARHAQALKSAAESLELVRRGLGLVDDSLQNYRHCERSVATPADLLAADLREAIQILGTITGEITTDEVLRNIFKNFCIGK